MCACARVMYVPVYACVICYHHALQTGDSPPYVNRSIDQYGAASLIQRYATEDVV